MTELRDALSNGERSLLDSYWNLLGQLVEIPTVSSDQCTDPFYRFIDSITPVLERIGFKVSVVSTTGKPLLLARLIVDEEEETTLIYQHYDVHGAGDMKEWRSDPFVPMVSNGRMYGRGSQDNKGQLCYVLAALESIIRNNRIRRNILLVLDGEEEIGSPSFLEHVDSIPLHKANLIISFDSVAPGEAMIPLVVSCRGFGSMSVTLETGSKPVHSGAYGGIVPNAAAHLMCCLTACIEENWGGQSLFGILNEEKYPDYLLGEYFNEERLLADTGALFLVETKSDLLRNNSYRKTSVEITGVRAGSESFSTAIPNTASARLVFRPPGGIRTKDVYCQLESVLLRHAPNKAKIAINQTSPLLDGFSNIQAADCVRDMVRLVENGLDQRCVVMNDGGCNPGICALTKKTDVPAFVTGVGLPSDGIHGPNESFSRTQLAHGYRLACLILGFSLNDEGRDPVGP